MPPGRGVMSQVKGPAASKRMMMMKKEKIDEDDDDDQPTKLAWRCCVDAMLEVVHECRGVFVCVSPP